MKVKIEIPPGYRRLRCGTKVRKGDLVLVFNFSGTADSRQLNWYEIPEKFRAPSHVMAGGIYIRKDPRNLGDDDPRVTVS